MKTEEELWERITEVFVWEECMLKEVNTTADDGLMENFCRDELGELFYDAGAEILCQDLVARYGDASNLEF